MTVLGQPTITYAYDNADRLTEITQGTATVTFAYDAANRRTSLTLPNGIVTEYAYDAASRLTGLTYKQGSTVLGSLTYSYDAAGSRTQTGGTWARTSLSAAVPLATYDAANQQLTFGGQVLTYDLNGNLTSNGTTLYTWDDRNRLASLAGLAGTASFQYDPLGRRTRKTIDGTTTGFLYDGLNPIQEASGAALTNLLTGLGIDEYFARTDGAGTRNLLRDALGSTLALTTATGGIQAEYTYEPFGGTTATGSDTNPFQYTGRENDGTGLYYYRARYYHPALQRFISEDPIEFAGGDVNLYAYVWNNPIALYDPFGLWGFGVTGGATGAAGVVVGAAGTLSVAGGIFGGSSGGINVGGCGSGGGFAGGPGFGPSYPSSNSANATLGGFGGVGGGAFVTNATSASQLGQTTHTISVDAGFYVKGSVQFSYGNGVWALSGTVGPGWGLSATHLATQSKCSESKSSR
jgi:RHS repeat-associated protein